MAEGLREFKPFVPPEQDRPELTARALLLGSFFGILFGAVTVYVGLRAGLTVAALDPHLGALDQRAARARPGLDS